LVCASFLMEGYMNKPKGLFQVAYERGLANTEHAQRYKVTMYTPAQKEDFTAAQRTDYEKYNLRHILGQCCDFVDELSQIGHTLDQIGGAGVEFTPVCHAELAGEGIEYGWGKSKRYFRKMRSKMSSDGASLEKITKDAFKALVDESLKHVTKKMALAFALKARIFKLAYHAQGDEQTPVPVSSTFKEIEDKVTHLKATTYKSHRGVSEAPVPGEE